MKTKIKEAKVGDELVVVDLTVTGRESWGKVRNRPPQSGRHFRQRTFPIESLLSYHFPIHSAPLRPPEPICGKLRRGQILGTTAG